MELLKMAIDKIRSPGTEKRWPVAVLVLILIMSLVSTVHFACNAGGPVYPPEVASEVGNNALRLKRYVELMREKKTSAEQDQKMIEANLKAWQALEAAMKKEQK